MLFLFLSDLILNLTDDVHYEMNKLGIFELFDINKIVNIEKSIVNFFAIDASQNETLHVRVCLLRKQVVSIVIMVRVSWLH